MTTTIDIPLDDLPDWMRQARRGIDWGVLLIIAFSTIIAMPFITQANLPHTNASENYVYRSADYANSLQEGRLYPRWSATAFGGYGAPIPHYYPPGAGYTPALIQLLLTDDPVLAVRIVYILALTLAGSIVYVFVTRRTDAAAGLLAGILYLYSPYIGLTAPHILGDLPGVMSLALIPMLLWSVDRLLMRNRPLDVMLIALSTSALYLTNFRAAIAATILTTILIVWHQQTAKRRTPWHLIIFSYLLGIGIASFYWIPALLEQDAIHWKPAFIPLHFSLNLSELVSPLQQIDVGEMVHTPQLTLGIPSIVFTLVGVISVIRFRPACHFQGLFLITGIGITTLTLIFFPTEIWLLGVISLCASIGGSAAIQWRHLLPQQWQRLYLPSILILIWILAAPVWLPPPGQEPFGSADVQTQIQHEQQGYGIAVVPPHMPVPSTIPDTLALNRFLLDGYQSNNINRIAPGQFSTDVQAGLLDHNTHGDRFQVRANTAVKLDILTAYFPGWRASISDHPVPLVRNPNTGLMYVDIPALSRGELFITLGSTSIRTASWIISWDLLLLLIVVTWRRFRRYHDTFDDLPLFTYQETRLLAAVFVACAVVSFLSNQPQFPLPLRSPSGHKLRDSILIQNRTDAGLNLLAFRLDNNQHHPDETVNLTLFWQAQRFLPENYKVKLSLVNNRDGSIGNEAAIHYPGNYPPRRWKTGLYVTDHYQLYLPHDIASGNYQIIIEVYRCAPDCSPNEQATFFDMNGQILGTKLTLPTLLTVSG